MKSYYLRLMQGGLAVEMGTAFASDKNGKPTVNKEPVYSDEDGYLIVDVPDDTRYITGQYVGSKLTIPIPANADDTIYITLPQGTGTNLSEVEIKSKKGKDKTWFEKYWWTIPVAVGVLAIVVFAVKKVRVK